MKVIDNNYINENESNLTNSCFGMPDEILAVLQVFIFLVVKIF